MRVRRTELRDKAKKLREQAMVSARRIEGTKNKRPPKKRNEDGGEMPADVEPRQRMLFDELVWEKELRGWEALQQSLVSWEAEGWHVTGKKQIAMPQSTVKRSGAGMTYQIGPKAQIWR